MVSFLQEKDLSQGPDPEAGHLLDALTKFYNVVQIMKRSFNVSRFSWITIMHEGVKTEYQKMLQKLGSSIASLLTKT